MGLVYVLAAKTGFAPSVLLKNCEILIIRLRVPNSLHMMPEEKFTFANLIVLLKLDLNCLCSAHD